MHSFIILCVTILFSVSALAVPIDDGSNKQNVTGKVCRPGASYSDGCNTVTCLPNHRVIHTDVACFTYDSNGQRVPIPEKEAPEDFWQKTETKKPERLCKPGATYNDGCNTVTCFPNHSVVRTLVACFTYDSNGQRVPIPEKEAPEDFWEKTETKKPERLCKPGATYHDGCNYNYCSPDNRQGSTKKACWQLDSNGEPVPMTLLEAPEDFWLQAETKKPKRICKPGASYSDGCNTVTCGPNSVQYQTLIGCDTLDANGTWHTKPVLEAPEDFWLKE